MESHQADRDIFIENIDRDEFRAGFLVTSQRKKLWNVQINLINKVARICEKYNIRWFAIGGTLLGAVRHKGFIPWDDDVDVIMFRPDYAKFQEVAAKEIQEPYFLDVWYNYRLESEGASLTDPEGDFQFITAEQEKNYQLRWISQWPSIRIRDSRTMMIEMPDRNFINQGIFVDVFPLDPLPPFETPQQDEKFNFSAIMTVAVASPERLKIINQDSPSEKAAWKEFLALPYKRRGEIFDKFMLKNFSPSERVGDIRDYALTTDCKYYFSKAFDDVVYLPFEKIKVPAPIGYESVLDTFYGNWRNPILTHIHSPIYSADVSYTEYFRENNFKKVRKFST